MAVAAPFQADYGLDDPLLVRRWFGRAGWMSGIGIFVWFINRSEYPGPSVRILVVFFLMALFCAAVAWLKIRSSRAGKLALRDQMLDSLALKGDEKVLDLGCGRGTLAVGAAKRLKSGKVTGVDTWDPQSVAGNSADAAKENAKAEGVADRVRFETLRPDSKDQLKLVYPDESFDAVVSCWWLHRLAGDSEREQMLREVFRILKPGGRVLIYDTWETGHYGDVLRGLGAKNLTLSPWSFLWVAPGRNLSAQK